MDWPDWSGETAVIVATGPSANTESLEIARGRARVVAIKNSWKLAPWADALYGCDKDWWIANRGAPKFKGLKFSPSPTVCKVYKDVRQITLKSRAEVLTKETGIIGCGLNTGGGNSGFQAINLAVQFGVSRIALVGFDMTLANGMHWHPEELGFARQDAARTVSYRAALDGCAKQFVTLGIEVVNCSPGSALKAYRKTTLDEAVNGSPNPHRTDRPRHRPDALGGLVAQGTVESVCTVCRGSDRGSEAGE